MLKKKADRLEFCSYLGLSDSCRLSVERGILDRYHAAREEWGSVIERLDRMDPEGCFDVPQAPKEDAYRGAERILKSLRRTFSGANLDDDDIDDKEPLEDILHYIRPHEEEVLEQKDQKCWYCHGVTAVLRQCSGCGQARYVSAIHT